MGRGVQIRCDTITATEKRGDPTAEKRISAVSLKMRCGELLQPGVATVHHKRVVSVFRPPFGQFCLDYPCTLNLNPEPSLSCDSIPWRIAFIGKSHNTWQENLTQQIRIECSGVLERSRMLFYYPRIMRCSIPHWNPSPVPDHCNAPLSVFIWKRRNINATLYFLCMHCLVSSDPMPRWSSKDYTRYS